MAENTAQVVISAEVKGLVAGLKQATSVFADSAKSMKATAEKISGGMDDVKKATESMHNSIDSMVPKMVKRFVTLAAAFEGIKAVISGTSFGLKMNSEMEGATIGIASLVAAQANITDANGKALQGQDKFNAAMRIGEDQMKKLRVAALETTATTRELVEGFQIGISAALQAGLSIDQARVITIRMAQAATSLHMPMNQLNEEIRALLGGNITPRNTRIATALGITNEKVKELKALGPEKLFDEITKRMEMFGIAGEKSAKTLQGQVSNLKEAAEIGAGEMTAPLAEKLKEGLSGALTGLFDMKTAEISESFAGIRDAGRDAFSMIGDLSKEAIQWIITKLKEVSAWLSTHQDDVLDILDSLKQVAQNLGGIVADMATLGGKTADVGEKTGGLTTLFSVIAGLVAAIRDGIRTLGTVILTVGEMIVYSWIKPLAFALNLMADVGAEVAGDDKITRTMRQWGGEANKFASTLSGHAKNSWLDLADSMQNSGLNAWWNQLGQTVERATGKTKGSGGASGLKTSANSKDTPEGKGGASVLSRIKAELEEEKAARSMGHEMTLAEERKFWESKLATVKKGSKDETQIRHEIARLTIAIKRQEGEAILQGLKDQSEENRNHLATKLADAEIYAVKVAQIHGKESKEYHSALRNITKIKQEQAKEEERIEQERYRNAVDLSNLAIEQETKKVDRMVEAGELTKNQAASIHESLLQEAMRYQLALIDLEMSSGEKTTIELEKLAIKKLEVEAKYQGQVSELRGRTAKEIEREALEMYAPLVQSWNQAIDGMLSGSMNLRTGMQTIWQGIGKTFNKLVLDMVNSWISGLLKQHAISISLWLKQKLFHQATTQEMTANTIKNASTEVAATGAVAGAKAGASVAAIPFYGWAMAIPTALAVAAAVFGLSRMIKSAAGGWDRVPNDQMAQIHKDEMVLPASLANRVRDMTDQKPESAPAAPPVFHINALDARSVARVLMDNNSEVSRALKQYYRDGGRS